MRKVPFLSNQPSVPRHQGIGRDDGLEFPKDFAPHRLRLPSKQRALRVREPYALAPQPFLQQAILGLEELNDDELTAMDPARHDHQQKW